MSTPSFVDGTGRGRRTAVILIAAVSVLALVAAIVTVIVLVNRGRAADSAAPPPPAVTADLPTGPVTQLKGQRTVEGVSVGYPHTAAGAVSAASEYMAQLGSTLDLDRVSAVARIVADVSYSTAPDRYRQARIDARKELGAPTEGPVPSGVSITVGPAAYQLRSVTDDKMTVLLLAFYTTTKADGTISPKVILLPVDMHWDGTDWKLLAPGASSHTDFSDLMAQPNTTEAQAKGWQAVVP